MNPAGENFLHLDERCSRHIDCSAKEGNGIMNFVALQMLLWDRAKYLGLIFAIAFSTFLMSHQSSIFAGICNSSAPFTNFPVFYTRYSQAITYVGRERNLMTFVLAKAAAGVSDAEACRRITAATGLRAETGSDFSWRTIWYYIHHTGIPVNFGITIAIALVVGIVV